jgi:hypothetical protein
VLSPQNRPDPTKTVTVKVTKSVVMTAEGKTVVTVIGRDGFSLTGPQRPGDQHHERFQKSGAKINRGLNAGEPGHY